MRNDGMNMGQERCNMVQHSLLCGTSPEVMHKLVFAGVFKTKQEFYRILKTT